MPTIEPNDITLFNLEGFLPPAEREAKKPIPKEWVGLTGADAQEWAEFIFHPPTGEVRRWVVSAKGSDWFPLPGGFRFNLVAIISDPRTGIMQPLNPLSAPTEATAKKLAVMLYVASGNETSYDVVPANAPYYRTAPEYVVTVKGWGSKSVAALVSEIWSIGSEAEWAARIRAKGGWLS